MQKSRLFVLDADVFIAAHRSYYAFDIAPGFWFGLIQHAASGNVYSISQVLDDLKKGYDPKKPDDYDVLANWAINDFHPYFMKTDAPEVTEAYADIMNWVFANRDYPRAAKDKFADISDSWLIAYTKAMNAILVTNENKLKRTSIIPIPAVCRQFGVECLNTFEMLRRLRIILA